MWLTRARPCGCTTDDGGPTDDLPRLDDPPFRTDESAPCAALCENMPTEPSLSFDRPPVSGSILQGEGLGRDGGDIGEHEFYGAVVTDAEAIEHVDDADGGPGVEPIDETDFSSEAILVVQAGWGSSARELTIHRIEETDDGIHAHGCYTQCSTLPDITYRTTAARFERPDALESVTVSLTIDPETRVTFSPDNGVVTIENGEAVEAETDFPRVDRPPYEITEPSCSPDASRDPRWMCENMSAEPSRSFEQEATSGLVLRDEGIDGRPETGTSQYYATLVTDEADLERVDREAGGDVGDLIAATDFSSAAVLVVQTGWGSSSVRPHLKRIEETDDGVHAFGCYTSPCAQTDDVSVRTVVARFERPDALESGAVSLTTDPETRVTFAANDEMVSVENDDAVVVDENGE